MRWIQRVVALVTVLLACGAGVLFAQHASPYRRYPLDYSGAPDPAGATMAITFERAVAGTYAAEVGGQVFTVNGSSTRVTDGTWPATLSGAQGHAWVFDGAIDLTSTIAPPAGDFSAFCVVTPASTSDMWPIGNTTLAGNLIGWVIVLSSGNVSFYLSDDGTTGGGHLSLVTDTGAYAAQRPMFVAVAYDWISDGGSKMYLWVDERTVVTSTTADGPVYASASDLSIGADGAGANPLVGTIGHCAYWDGVVKTAAEFASLRRQYRGMVSTGTSPVTVVSASPPAIPLAAPTSGTEPFLVELPANAGQVGAYGIYGPPAVSNLVQRASFESWTDANTPTGWTEVESAGAGAATSSEETSRVAHEGSSAKGVTTAADSSVYWVSVCVDIVDTTTYYFDTWSFGASGDDDFSIRLRRYTDDACTDDLTVTNIIVDQDVPEAWTHYGDVSPAWGTTESIKIEVGFFTIATTAWVDAVSMRAASTPTDAGCYADTDSTAVCTTGVHSIHQPLSKNGSWTIKATVRSPIDGAVGNPARYIFFVSGTAADNNQIVMYWASDTLNCTIRDSGGVAKTSSVVAAGNADTDYEVKMYHSSSGAVGCCWGSTCDATPASGALMDDISATFYLAGLSSGGADINVKNVRFFKGLR